MKTTKLLMVGVAVALSACGSLQNVNQEWCPPKEATPVPVVSKVERINLAADALFGFDKSSVSDLLPKGRATLDDLARQLSEGYVKVDRIDLIGHTDRLGSAQYNYNLGLQRAGTVRDYLKSKGVTAPMTVASEGKNRPLSTSCVASAKNRKASAELKACLQVDRRVEVKILGTRKVN